MPGVVQLDEEKKEMATTAVISVDEKAAFDAFAKGDEALELAGAVRHEYTEEESKAIRRKIDFRVIPILAAV